MLKEEKKSRRNRIIVCIVFNLIIITAIGLMIAFGGRKLSTYFSIGGIGLMIACNYLIFKA